MVLSRSFYERDTQIVAIELLGKKLVLERDGQTYSGIIVETEAYLGGKDAASHAFRGPTPRNQVMFGEPGFSYVYFTYGFHHCVNVTTERNGVAGAVLIRALEPVSGIEQMKKNRKDISKLTDLTNGPGKLAQAFGLSRSDSGRDLTIRGFHLEESRCVSPLWIGTSPRIGIKNACHYLFRFFIQDSSFVSRAPKKFSERNLAAVV